MFHLNKDVLISVLTTWFGMKDVGSLDSAVCNKTQRVTFLQLLKSEVAVFNGMEDSVRVGKEYICWMHDRDLSLSYLRLSDWPSTKSAFRTEFPSLRALKHLKIENYSFVETLPLIGTAKQCEKLEKLEIFGSLNVMDSVVEAFVSHCPLLSVLTVDTLSYFNDVRAVMGYMKKNYNANTTLTRNGLISILMHGSNLTRLEVCNHAQLKLGGSDAKWLATSACPKLTHLKLSGSSCLNDESVALIVKHSPGLTHVDLKDCIGVTDRTLSLLAQQAPRLQRLGVNSRGITDEGLRALTAKCNCIEHLDINGCEVTDRGVASLVAKNPLLKYVSLKRIESVDNAVRALSECCPLLEHLGVGRSGFGHEVETEPPSPLSAASLSQLTRRCPRMHTFDLTDCNNLDSAVRVIAQHCPLLRDVRLTGGSRVSEAAIVLISECCPLFESLDAEHCDNITDRAVVSLAQKCRQMTYLNVSYCGGVTDVGVRSVAQHCPQMISFTFNACRAVTVSAVLEVSQACPRLAKLMCLSVRRSVLILQSVMLNNPFMIELGVSIDSSVSMNSWLQLCRDLTVSLRRVEISQVADH